MHIKQFADPDLIMRLRNVPGEEEVMWPNAYVTAQTKCYAKDVPESAFTIFSNLSGRANIHYQDRDLRVCEETLMIINPYDKLSYQIDDYQPVHTCNVHYQFDTYTAALSSLTQTEEELLDHKDSNETCEFVPQLHYKDPYMKNLLHHYDEEDSDSYLLRLFEAVLGKDRQIRSRIAQIPAAKASTRKELISRMMMAKDMMFSHFDNPDFDLSGLSREVGMSRYHFLRVFKRVFGYSPHQMLKTIRLERAKYLLENTDLPVTSIAYKVGYSEPNAIYPLLKEHLSTTPAGHRKISNFQ